MSSAVVEPTTSNHHEERSHFEEVDYEDGSFIVLPHNQSFRAIGNEPVFNLHERAQMSESTKQIKEAEKLQNDLLENEAKVRADIAKMWSAAKETFKEDRKENESFSGFFCAGNITNSNDENDSCVISSFSSATSEVFCLEDANAQINKLLEKNKELVEFLKESSKKSEKNSAITKNLEEQVRKTEKEAEEMERKYQRSTTVIEKLRAQILDLTTEIEAFKAGGDGQNTSALQQILTEKDSLIEHVNGENKKLKTLIRGLEFELARQNLYLSREHKEVCDAYEQAKLTISTLNEYRLKKEAEVKNFESALAEVEENNLKLIVENDELKTALESKDEVIADLNKALESSKTDLNTHVTQCDGIDEKIDLLEQTIAQKNAIIKTATEERDLYKAQMEEYRQNFEEERKDRIGMKMQKDDVESKYLDVSRSLKEKIDELNQLNRSQNNDLNVATTAGASYSSIASTSDEFVFVQPSNGPTQMETTVTVIPEVNLNSELTSNVIMASVNPHPILEEIISELSCPVCKKGFKTQNSLITHASTCGDPLVTRSTFVFP